MNEQQRNACSCCETEYGFGKKFDYMKRKEWAVLRELVKSFAVVKQPIFLKKYFPIKTETGSLPSGNNRRSRKRLSIVKILLWNERKKQRQNSLSR